MNCMQNISTVRKATIRYLGLLVTIGVCLPLWAGTTDATPATKSEVVAAYRQRLEVVRTQIPEITRAAEAVAKRWVEKKQTLLHFPFGGDTSNFTMEFCSRAGGLENSQPNTVRLTIRSANDVIVMAPRSWEKGGAFLKEELTKARADGWMIIVFGSRRGMPKGLRVDFLIDNGAADGSEKEAALNQIVNVTSGWIWCCELTSALTRLGQRPAVLKGMPLPGAADHNKDYLGSETPPHLYPCDTPIPAGKLANIYLEQIGVELATMEGKKIQDQIVRAADMAVAHLKAGKKIWASSFTHILDGEVLENNRSPMGSFRGISCGEKGEAFHENVKPGDLLFFFGEWSTDLPWFDYIKVIRKTHADYILSCRLGNEPTDSFKGKPNAFAPRVKGAAMVLEQPWPFENAVVPIPFPPGKMAPVSGVHVCLLYRMLDEKIAVKLSASAPKP